MSMKITLNGEDRTVQPDASLGELLEMLDLKGKRIAVEVNREIVPRSEYDNFKLTESDTIEIVNAIGGG
ncbi:MAG: sulfur carrier protein ThiS [Gammaproteobacteria bacterium]